MGWVEKYSPKTSDPVIGEEESVGSGSMTDWSLVGHQVSGGSKKLHRSRTGRTSRRVGRSG